MKITYDILKNLLRCNKGIKLKFRDDTNILEVSLNNKVVLSLELINNSIEEHSDLIYNSIINLEDITLYIPKIYINER